MKIRKLDFLELVGGVAETMAKNHIRPEDVRNVAAVKDYLRLRSEGHKYEYIMHYLCEQYDIRRTALYKAIRRLTQEVEI